MLSHALTPYQTVFLKLMKNVVGVYASTLEFLKQCDLQNENILCSLKKDIYNDDHNRLLFFEVCKNVNGCIYFSLALLCSHFLIFVFNYIIIE